MSGADDAIDELERAADAAGRVLVHAEVRATVESCKSVAKHLVRDHGLKPFNVASGLIALACVIAEAEELDTEALLDEAEKFFVALETRRALKIDSPR